MRCDGVTAGRACHAGLGSDRVVKIHFVVLGGVEEPQVQLPLIHQGLAHGGDLLIHDIQGGVHRVVELQLVFRRNAPDVEGVILRRMTNCAREDKLLLCSGDPLRPHSMT